jgi:lysophospholipase L1-like esterase
MPVRTENTISAAEGRILGGHQVTHFSRLAAPTAGILLLIGALFAFSLTGVLARSQASVASQTIVAVGDSITYGMYDQEGLGGWVGRLENSLNRMYPAQSYDVVNAGINGDTSAGVLHRLTKDVISRNPGLVIVAIGTNDFDYHVPVAQFRANLVTIIQRITSQTHAAVLVQSFLPEVRVPSTVLTNEAAYNAVVPAVCRQQNVVPAVCRQQNVGYQDLFDASLALGRATMTNLRHDSEHPTAAGYRLIAAETLAMLQSAYLSPQGALVPVTSAPGTDSLLPDDELAGTAARI